MRNFQLQEKTWKIEILEMLKTKSQRQVAEMLGVSVNFIAEVSQKRNKSHQKRKKDT